MRSIYSLFKTGSQDVSPFLRNMFFVVVLSPLATACHSGSAAPGSSDTARTNSPALSRFRRNPEFRDHVKKEPVGEYRLRTDDKLNEQYFSVRLYETHETMKYLAKVDYEGIGGDDTIRLPDVGIPPQPVLQKGPEKYSCIIGLMDNQNTFRPLKKVYVTEKGGELKITTLKHYVVTEDYKLQGQ